MNSLAGELSQQVGQPLDPREEHISARRRVGRHRRVVVGGRHQKCSLEALCQDRYPEAGAAVHEHVPIVSTWPAVNGGRPQTFRGRLGSLPERIEAGHIHEVDWTGLAQLDRLGSTRPLRHARSAAAPGSNKSTPSVPIQPTPNFRSNAVGTPRIISDSRGSEPSSTP